MQTPWHLQTGLSSQSWLWGRLPTNSAIAKVWFTACNWSGKILPAMEMHSITTSWNSSAKRLSECLHVQMTNNHGKWFRVTRTAFIITSTVVDAQGMAVLPNSMFPPSVGQWAQQEWLIGRGLGWEFRRGREILSITEPFFPPLCQMFCSLKFFKNVDHHSMLHLTYNKLSVSHRLTTCLASCTDCLHVRI